MTPKHLRQSLATAAMLCLSGLAPSSALAGPTQLRPANTDNLSGTTRLACEAILCLSSADRPAECNPALAHFFGLKKRKLRDLLTVRLEFLSLCPAAHESAEMRSLVSALAQGAGRCDAKTLNRLLRHDRGPGGDYGTTGSAISDKLPNYCSAQATHAYSALRDTLPKYVGKPEADGFWADARDYPAALARYEREQARKKARHENGGGN